MKSKSNVSILVFWQIYTSWQQMASWRCRSHHELWGSCYDYIRHKL